MPSLKYQATKVTEDWNWASVQTGGSNDLSKRGRGWKLRQEEEVGEESDIAGKIKGLDLQLDGKTRSKNSCGFLKTVTIHYFVITGIWNWFNMIHLNEITFWSGSMESRSKESTTRHPCFTVLKIHCADHGVCAYPWTWLVPGLWALPWPCRSWAPAACSALHGLRRWDPPSSLICMVTHLQTGLENPQTD